MSMGKCKQHIQSTNWSTKFLTMQIIALHLHHGFWTNSPLISICQFWQPYVAQSLRRHYCVDCKHIAQYLSSTTMSSCSREKGKHHTFLIILSSLSSANYSQKQKGIFPKFNQKLFGKPSYIPVVLITCQVYLTTKYISQAHCFKTFSFNKRISTTYLCKR